MIGIRKYSTIWLIRRSLLPSPISLLMCLVGGLLFVLLDVFVDSVKYGTILPNAFSGQLATLYTNGVVLPVETVTQGAVWNNFSSIVVWGVAGICIYELFSLCFRLYDDWRTTKNEVKFSDKQTIVRHPLEHSFILRSAWHFALSIVGFVMVLLTRPLFARMFNVAHKIVTTGSGSGVMGEITLTILGWALCMHCIIVFLRLYLLRTRLLGDDLLQ